MDGMRDFPPDFAEPFVISFNYFKACNVRFFDDSAPFWRKYWRFFIMVVVVFFTFMSMLMYMIRVLGSKSIVDMAFLTASCLVGIQSILKAIVTLPKKKDIENLIRGLAKMWKTENLSDIQIAGKNRRIKQLNIGLTVFYWGATMAIIQNLSPQLIYTVFGKINQQDFDFILPYGYVYPFDPLKNWGRYLLVYFLQCYSIFQLINYYLGTQCLIVALCSQLSTEFALLREDMKHAIPVPNKNKTQELSVDKNMTIESMISIHQELIKLARLLNYIFNRMVFIDLCFFAAIVCFFAISFSLSNDTIDKIVSIVSIIMLLIMIYLFCYYCEMLKEESAGIAEAAYENPWYEGGTHYQKTIRFIIMRAQLPCCVTSLNYSPISLNTFTKVVSTTWSYFSLAMTVCGND